jgi:two-component system response regulator YesN
MLFPNNDSKQILNSVIGEKINEIMGMNVLINTEEMTIRELYDIYNDNSTVFEKTEEIKAEDNNQKAKQILINQVKEYIENNYSKGILKNDVADYFNINKDYLGRIFKEGTGKSISEYMLEIRINKAKELIAKNYSHSQICQSIGYIDTRSFRRLFLKVTGMTLQEYKERYLL